MISYIEKRLSDLSPKQSDEKLPQAAVLILLIDNAKSFEAAFKYSYPSEYEASFWENKSFMHKKFVEKNKRIC